MQMEHITYQFDIILSKNSILVCVSEHNDSLAAGRGQQNDARKHTRTLHCGMTVSSHELYNSITTY